MRMNTREIKKFKRFLKEQNIYYAFRYNYDNEFGFRGLNYTCVQYMSAICLPENVFVYAFSWENSKEGATFWQTMDSRWRLIVADEKEISGIMWGHG